MSFFRIHYTSLITHNQTIQDHMIQNNKEKLLQLKIKQANHLMHKHYNTCHYKTYTAKIIKELINRQQKNIDYKTFFASFVHFTAAGLT